MLLEDVLLSESNHQLLRWIDIELPSGTDLDTIAKSYGLPSHAVQDCLESEHLPKFEKLEDFNFIIVRAYDETASPEADTVQELTRKVAVFEKEGLLITLHRVPLRFLTEIKNEWRKRAASDSQCQSHLVFLSILKGAIQTFQAPVLQNRKLLEELEEKMFMQSQESLEEGYYLRRRASSFKRTLRMDLDILSQLKEEYQEEAPVLQDVLESGQRLSFYADEFYENVTSLLSMYLTLASNRLTIASNRSNDVMRILTLFSVFFLPLNLVTGIYGMNFEKMPEIKWEYGYPFALVLMLIITGTVWGYFKRQRVL